MIRDFESCSWALRGALTHFRSANVTLRPSLGLINPGFKSLAGRIIKFGVLSPVLSIVPKLFLNESAVLIDQRLPNFICIVPCSPHID